jgi:hypothetical protein
MIRQFTLYSSISKHGEGGYDFILIKQVQKDLRLPVVFDAPFFSAKARTIRAGLQFIIPIEEQASWSLIFNDGAPFHHFSRIISRSVFLFVDENANRAADKTLGVKQSRIIIRRN